MLHRLAAATADAAHIAAAAAAAAAHRAPTTMQSRVETVLPEIIASDPEVSLSTVTFCANSANDLTCPPLIYIII